jgi:hypothetical protein
MKITHRLLLTIFLFISSGHENAVLADTAEQQELDQALEMLKAQGMDPQQLQQMENMLKNIGQMEARKKDARITGEQQAFEAETTGYGTAQVEVEGKRYDLTVTKCEVKDSKSGNFIIKARQAPGMEDGELSVYSDERKSGRSVQFSTRSTPPENYRAENPELEFDGKTLDWTGTVESNARKVSLSLSLACGAEAIYFDKPSRPRPDTPANTLTLYLGSETYEFEAGRCSFEAYRTGNLMVDFEATATGNFRGRPAIVLLTKSHGVGLEGRGAGYFHNFDLLLGELSAEQRRLSPLDVKKQLSEVVETYRTRELLAHQKKYNKDTWNNVPPDKLNEMLEASSQEMSVFMDKAAAMRYPEATSHGGVVTIDGRDVLFRGQAMSTSDASRAPEFGDLAALTEAFVTCQ